MLGPVVDQRLVSSGRPPRTEQADDAPAEAYDRYGHDPSGSLSAVYPARAEADPGLFGTAVVTVKGEVHESGDAKVLFTLISVAKPFVLALVCEKVGLSRVRQLVGVNAMGLSLDSVRAVERSPGGRSNPMVNPGAIATTSLVPGGTTSEQWAFVLDGPSRFAGHDVDKATLESALATNHRNRALANMLRSVDAPHGDPAEAVDAHTKQSCVSVSAIDLAVKGATLASGGTNPVTGHAVIVAQTARDVPEVMIVGGLYKSSGDWLLDVGIPGKNGISSGIVCVSPGKGSIGTFAPWLNDARNSVRGQLVAIDRARRLGLDVLSAESTTRLTTPSAAG